MPDTRLPAGQVPAPANDNLPRPANDNRRARMYVRGARRAVRLGREIAREAQALRGFVRVADRVLPILDVVDLALTLEELRQRQFAGATSERLNGWQRCPSPQCGDGPGGVWTWGLDAGPDGPQTTCAIQTGVSGSDGKVYTDADQIPASTAPGQGLTHWWDTRPSGSVLLGNVGRQYWRPAGLPATALPQPGVAWPAVWGGATQPSWLPAIDPEALPIGQPVPALPALPVRVLPYRRPNPWRVPGYRWEAGNAAPGESRRPWRRGREVGGVRVDPVNDVPPLGRPPGPRVKERKIKWNAGLHLIWHAVGSVTEAIDFIKAFHDALPYRYKHHGRHGKVSHAPQRMLADLYRHWDHVDLNKAVWNLLVNEVEDRVIGTLASGANRLNRHPAWARPVGVLSGPAL